MSGARPRGAGPGGPVPPPRDVPRRPAILRRTVLGAVAAGAAASGLGLGAWAGVVEPGLLLRTTRYAVAPAGWPADFPLTIAVVTDLHAAEPHMPLSRVERIARHVADLVPDLVVVLGDHLASHRWVTRRPGHGDVARILAGLRPPLGTWSVLGNHDWWDDAVVQAARAGTPAARAAIEAAGLPVLANRAVRLLHRGRPLWLAGLDSQWAFRHAPGGTVGGADDLAATLAQVTDAAPVVLLAHEPDVFARVPARVSLTLSGHTHGGQVRLAGRALAVPSRYGARYAYGHVVEDGRHLVVSGGLGCSILPVRFGMPPEVVAVDLGGTGA